MPSSRGEVFKDVLGDWRFRIIDRAGKVTVGRRGYALASEAKETLVRLGVAEKDIEHLS